VNPPLIKIVSRKNNNLVV